MKEINEAKGPDQIVDLTVDGITIKMRVIRLMLDSHNEEILVTNLLDESFGLEDFKELYFKRWGIEVKFNELKNRLQKDSLVLMLLEDNPDKRSAMLYRIMEGNL